jgi:hypothetical protein
MLKVRLKGQAREYYRHCRRFPQPLQDAWLLFWTALHEIRMGTVILPREPALHHLLVCGRESENPGYVFYQWIAPDQIAVLKVTIWHKGKWLA